jgi:hypothetical protein
VAVFEIDTRVLKMPGTFLAWGIFYFLLFDMVDLKMEW